MKTITVLQSEIKLVQSEMDAVRENYHKRMEELTKQMTELRLQRQLLLADVNLGYVIIAESILSVSGDISKSCEGQVLSELAANDIANGCKHLRKEFYGNKNYDAYYQRCDCQYGYGPRHGSIVESVGLKSQYQTANLTEEQKDACIYYLLNFKKILKAKEVSKN